MSNAPASLPRSAATSRADNVVAVASGKGGVGKTWFAITLTHALARCRQRALLFDGDLGLANVDIQLGLMPQHDLGGVLGGRLTLSQAVLAHDAGGFDIIAGRSGSGRLANVPANRVQMVTDELMTLARGYDRVVLDLGAGVERTVRQLTRAAALCIVVTTDEPTSLTDAYAFIKLTHLERPNADIRVVVNMANSTREGERTHNTLRKACEGFLKLSPPLLGVVRRDAKVRDAIRSQMSILTRHPGCEAAADVQAIADRLMAEVAAAETP